VHTLGVLLPSLAYRVCEPSVRAESTRLEVHIRSATPAVLCLLQQKEYREMCGRISRTQVEQDLFCRAQDCFPSCGRPSLATRRLLQTRGQHVVGGSPTACLPQRMEYSDELQLCSISIHIFALIVTNYIATHSFHSDYARVDTRNS
jgi:hypothetical protein